MTESYYTRLSSIDVKGVLEKKQNLDYLSWAHALHFLLLEDPAANWDVLPSETYADGSVMVWTQVTAFGITRKQWLPVMDHRNKAVPNPDAFLVNKNIQRCLVKNIAAFGLGLSVYAGEDLPEATQTVTEKKEAAERSSIEGRLQTLTTKMGQCKTTEELNELFSKGWTWAGKHCPTEVESIERLYQSIKSTLPKEAA